MKCAVEVLASEVGVLMGFPRRFFVQTIIGACAPFWIVFAGAMKVLLLAVEVLAAEVGVFEC